LPTGGWGYRKGGEFFVEPTALALLALAPRDPPQMPVSTEGDTPTTTGLRAMLACSRPDGWFGAFQTDPDPSWSTSPAILALWSQGHESTARQSARWLASWRPPQKPRTAEEDAKVKRVLKIDVSIQGWAWMGDEEFATVEPTALGAIALHAVGGSVGAERIAEAMRYFRDRQCVGGGWNYGNPHLFDADLPPICLPTVKALLSVALCGGASLFAIEDSVATLTRLLEGSPSRKAHAWAGLAFAALDRTAPARSEAMRSVDSGDGAGPFAGGPDVTALSVLALRAALGEAPSCLSRRSA
jgi:hypothetical protein